MPETALRQVLHDPLTGLPNRDLFQDRLSRAVGRARRRSDYAFAVLLLDLDRFQVINGSLGHTMGDDLLRAVAQRLEDCARSVDTIARLGGDEFAILLDDCATPVRQFVFRTDYSTRSQCRSLFEASRSIHQQASESR